MCEFSLIQLEQFSISHLICEYLSREPLPGLVSFFLEEMALHYLISIWKSVCFEAETGKTQSQEAIWAAPVKGLPSCC